MRPIRKFGSEEIKKMCNVPTGQGSTVIPASLELFNQGLPIRVVRHCAVAGSVAELHLHEDDLWLCIEGEASFVLGGKLINPRTEDGLTYLADSILEGEVVTMRAGDWLHIPAGQPHQPVTSMSADLIIIKLSASEGRVVLNYL